MVLSKIIQKFRARADDKVANPYFWDDDEATEFANEIVEEAVIRGRLITDNTTTDICQIALDDATLEYPLDPRVIDVEECFMKLVTVDGEPDRYRPLVRASYDSIAYDPLARPAPGRPFEYAVIEGNGGGLSLVLSRLPRTDLYERLQLTVFRLPLQEMATPDPSADPPVDPTPEINPKLHRGIVWGMLWLAFETRDADKGDAVKAAKYEKKFTDMFGERESADVERKQLAHRATIMLQDGCGRRGRRGRFGTGYHPSPYDPN